MHSVFTNNMAATCGIQMGELRSAASCCVERLHRGMYAVVKLCSRHPLFTQLADQTMVDLFARADAQKRNPAWRKAQTNLHTAKAELIAESAHPDDVLSHSTAALLHGLPIKAVPEAVEMINPNLSRAGATFRRRYRQIGESEIDDWRGFAITNPVRTAVDLAADESIEYGTAVLDAILREAPLQREQLLAQAHEIAEAYGRRAGCARVRSALSFANGLAESYGESVCMVKLRMLGIDNLEQQVEIFDEDGIFVARVDGLVRDKRIIIEFDGAVKYLSTADGGFNGEGDQLLREKEREHQLHRLGYTVVRIMWNDLLGLDRLRARLKALGILS